MLRQENSTTQPAISLFLPETRYRVERLVSLDACRQITESWNALAGQRPMQRWEWLGTWWQHYGHLARRELYVLVVRDTANRVCGIAPWYLDTSASRSIRFLGDGKVCTDYNTILAQTSDTVPVTRAIAQWLQSVDHPRHAHAWDSIDWEAVLSHDRALGQLGEEIRSARYPLWAQPVENCHVAELPETVEDYIRSRSPTNRTLMRRIRKKLEQGIYSVKQIQEPNELDDEHWSLFEDLHELRRGQLGERGCFSHPPFGSFLREATTRLMDAGMSSLLFAYEGETPMAVVLLLHNDQTTFMYQSGMDHGVNEPRPGYVATVVAIWKTIERGGTQYDFLRGDEPYKKRWRTTPRPLHDVRISSRRAAAKFRHSWVVAGRTIKEWMKTGVDGESGS